MRSELFPRLEMMRWIFPSFLSRLQLAAFCSAIVGTSPNLDAASQPLSRFEARQLEQKIWTAEGDELEACEGPAAKIIQTDPASAFGHYLLAQLYLKQFRQNPSQLKLLKQASELGQQAIELRADLDFGYLIASQVLDIMGYSDNALAILDGDEKIAVKSSWRSDYQKALLLSAQRADREAIQHFQASLDRRDALEDVVVPAFVSALKVIYQGDALAEQLRVQSSRFHHRLFEMNRAIALGDLKRYEEAHSIYAALEKRYPDFLEAQANDAILLYSRLAQKKSAERMFFKLLEEKGFSAQNRALVKAHLASLLLDDKTRAADAKRLFTESIAESSNKVEWISFSHKAYEKKDRLQDFVDLLDELRFAIQPTPYIYALRGEVQSESLAQHDLAIASFESAIALDPDRSEFYNGLGLAYYRLSNYNEALKVFLEAIRVDPQDATSRYNHACVLAIMNRPEEALGSLREAIGLDPRLQQTARNDKDFARLRDLQGFRFLTNPRANAAALATP